MKEIPKSLKIKWQEFWDIYSRELGDLDDQEKNLLHDFCYWEAMKEKLKEEVEMYGETYQSEKGYTQSTAYYSSLLKAQEMGEKLRDKIWKEGRPARKSVKLEVSKSKLSQLK